MGATAPRDTHALETKDDFLPSAPATAPKLFGGPDLRWDRAFYIFFALFSAIALATFRDYGYSWDEVWQNRWYGQAVLRFLATLGGDLGATTENNFYLYGGTFDALAELLVNSLPMEARNARHLANLGAALLALWGTWKTARLVGGPAAGFWAALFLALTPPFYGHAFINAKDIPFAAGYIWSLYYLLRLAANFPTTALRDRLLLGLVLGLTLGVRIGGLLILCYGAVLFALHLWSARGHNGSTIVERVWGLLKTALPVVALAYPLMLAFWPAALLRPLAMPLEALQEANRFRLSMHLLWNGQTVLSNDLPWNYLPVLFAVELPEVLVVLLLAALPWACYRLWQRRASRCPSSPGLLLLLLAALFPPAWAILSNATLYDNMRHFLFILPPLCAIAGLAFAACTAWLTSRRPGLGWLATAGVALALGWSVAQMASLHPYQYAYLNAFAGGMPAGAKRFERDYWITSYREAAAQVEAHARRAAAVAGVPFTEVGFTVALVGSSGIGEDLLPAHFSTYRYGFCDRTDYLIATTRLGADGEWPDYPILGTVGRRGMTFAVVKVAPELARLVVNGGKGR